MKIYKDKEMTEEIENDTFELGIVPAGEIKRFTFWVYNDSPAHLKNLQFIIGHDEVKILEAPIELIAQAIGELIIEWKPSITLKEGLKTPLRIKGIELWG